MKEFVNKLQGEKFILFLNNLTFTNVPRVLDSEFRETVAKIEDSAEVADELVVLIKHGDVKLYLFIKPPYSKVKSKISYWDQEISGISKVINPLNVLRVYARNIVHDFRGSINIIASLFKFIENDVKEVKKEIRDSISEARDHIESNLAFVGLGRPKELAKEELVSILRCELTKYFNISFSLNVDVKREVEISDRVFRNSLLILLNQLFNNYQFEDALVSLKAPLGKLVLRLDFDGRINNIND